MGYTHYFTLKGSVVARFPDLAADAVHLFNTATAQGIALAGPLGTGLPDVSDQTIRFNGAEPRNYETFSLRASDTDFNFCKTGPQPYDAVVAALLIRAKHLLGETIEISSDGTWDEWADGRALYEKAFAEAPICPWELTDA